VFNLVAIHHMWRQAQFLKFHILGHFKDGESYVYLGAVEFINFLDTLLLNSQKKLFSGLSQYISNKCGDKEAFVALWRMFF
jgi:hypothetical protein